MYLNSVIIRPFLASIPLHVKVNVFLKKICISDVCVVLVRFLPLFCNLILISMKFFYEQACYVGDIDLSVVAGNDC